MLWRTCLGFMQILCHLNNSHIPFLRQEIDVRVGLKCQGSSLRFGDSGTPATHHSPGSCAILYKEPEHSLILVPISHKHLENNIYVESKKDDTKPA